MERKRCKLKEITETVKNILEVYPKARDDDYLLYGYYMNKQKMSVEMSFRNLCAVIKEGDLPTFESVGRARRKIQEKCPELRGTTYVRKLRKEQEEEYREFAREN